MIKTVSKIVFIGLALATIIGCSEKEPKAEPTAHIPTFECKVENVLAPRWTCIPEVPGYYAGVGIADKSAAGNAHMRKVAIMNGRTELNNQIQIQVKDKMTGYTGVTGNGTNEVVDKVTKAVTSQVAKINLRGSKPVDMWIAPSDAVYMLVTVPEATVNSVVKDSIKKAVASSYKNDDARWQQFQSQQALDDLDKEFPTD